MGRESHRTAVAGLALGLPRDEQAVDQDFAQALRTRRLWNQVFTSVVAYI